MLYTVMAYEDIFPSTEKAPQIKVWRGYTCYVHEHEQGTYEIVQLLSTDPRDFLQEDLQPGKRITNDPFD